MASVTLAGDTLAGDTLASDTLARVTLRPVFLLTLGGPKGEKRFQRFNFFFFQIFPYGTSKEARKTCKSVAPAKVTLAIQSLAKVFLRPERLSGQKVILAKFS